ncbi:MAG: hypothetical protein AAF204_04350 [Pseudomonadota bacterium]
MGTSKPPSGEERRHNRDHENYFNAQFDAEPFYVEPGKVICAHDEEEMLVATVGSGVLMAIFDQELKTGVMGYVVLPDPVLEEFPFLDKADQALVQKAFEPIENCIGEMKRQGAGKTRIKIRLFGGNILEDDNLDRGLKHTVFVQEYLSRKGLQVFSTDIGGPFVRRVHFFPTTGRAVRRLLRRESDYADMAELEGAYNKNLT